MVVVVELRGRNRRVESGRVDATIERTDLLDQRGAEVVPRIDASLRQTPRDSERATLPWRFEHQLAVDHRRRRGAAQFVCLRHTNLSTPIIASRVTRATSSSSGTLVASFGACGNTR